MEKLGIIISSTFKKTPRDQLAAVSRQLVKQSAYHADMPWNQLAVAWSLIMYILVGTFDRGCGGEIAIGEE